MLGALAGNCTQTYPIVLGAGLGVGCGVLYSAIMCMVTEEETKPTQILNPVTGSSKELEENPTNP